MPPQMYNTMVMWGIISINNVWVVRRKGFTRVGGATKCVKRYRGYGDLKPLSIVLNY